ncbi:hypothetical protein NUACC21_03380 [Scytonema sp. NUACC21]
MSSNPDCSAQGYQITSELGRNREGGRITWLASQLKTGQQVVLKQFCFAVAGSSWSAFNAYDREIQVLQGLNHKGIPRYLGAFSTNDGFCLVQQYINGLSLAVPRSFDPYEIKQIAISILEILVYLQNRIPCVIHRDIKPENILVDNELNVYLIDFGFARIGSQEVSGSSVFKGTPGFIPPEQLRKPTEASDLYGLGATIVCLLTNTPSTAIVELTDEDDPYLIHFKHLLPRLNVGFLNWLEKMVHPRLKNRFANAEMALNALKPLEITLTPNSFKQTLSPSSISPASLKNHHCLVPKIEISPTVVNFRANSLGERLMQSVSIHDPESETQLDVKWEAVPHPHDPPQTADYYPWISVTPMRFARNYAHLQVWVNTSKLLPDKLYERQLLLHINSSPQTHTLTVKVRTASLSVARRKLPYAGLIWLGLATNVAAIALTWAANVFGNIPIIFAMYGAVFGFARGVKTGRIVGFVKEVTCGTVAGVVAGATSGIIARACGLRAIAPSLVCVAFLIGTVVGIPMGNTLVKVIDAVACNTVNRGFTKGFTTVLIILTLATGTSLGSGFVVGFLNPYILWAVAATALPLATLLVLPLFQYLRLVTKYRSGGEGLIKP